jgi:ectoine hydroxylase-related dioxygenase (phytanoyl-CoA dioxygenase family)
MNNYQELYHRDGYLVVPGLFDTSEIQALKTETAAIFRGERGKIEGLLPIGNNDTDEDVLRRYVAIHFPHKLSTHIKEVLGHPGVIQVLRDIVSPNLKAMQSMLFVKGPGKAGQAWHQDEYYIPTRDRSLVGVWIAIDDANLKNGCLWIIPGSHKSGYMMPRVPNIDTEFADVDTIDVSTWNGQPIAVEVKAGDVVFFNGYTLHSSRENHTADCFRTALVNHYMSAESMLPWDQDGKLTATEDLRDIILVAGVDPYAWKGTVDVNKPYLRPEVLNIKTEA